MTAAAMASPMSSPLTPRRTGAVAGTAREGAAAVVVVVRVAVVVAVPGRGAVAGAAVAGLGGVGAGGAAAAEAAAGAAGAAPGTLGSLIVAVGLGGVGRLMRTVSFFGWTFAGSGLGGTPPPGTFGVLSAIVFRQCKLGLPPRTVKRYSRAN
jgi:hypothetical protein